MATMASAVNFNLTGQFMRNRYKPPMAIAISQPSFEPVQKNAAPPRRQVIAMTIARIAGRNFFVPNASVNASGINNRTAPASALG